MQTEVANYPAYKIFKREPNANGVTEITINDQLALPVKDYYESFLPFSVASYAISNNDCPIKAVQRETERKHELYGLINQGAYLSSGKRVQETRILIEVGMKIYFQGKTFEIVAAPNHNLNLKEI